LWKYFYPFHFFFLWLPILKMQNDVEFLMDLNPESEARLAEAGLSINDCYMLVLLAQDLHISVHYYCNIYNYHVV
jgi:hypothetical protein